jgi:hypothetical protein
MGGCLHYWDRDGADSLSLDVDFQTVKPSAHSYGVDSESDVGESLLAIHERRRLRIQLYVKINRGNVWLTERADQGDMEMMAPQKVLIVDLETK